MLIVTIVPILPNVTDALIQIIYSLFQKTYILLFLLLIIDVGNFSILFIYLYYLFIILDTAQQIANNLFLLFHDAHSHKILHLIFIVFESILLIIILYYKAYMIISYLYSLHL